MVSISVRLKFIYFQLKTENEQLYDMNGTGGRMANGLGFMPRKVKGTLSSVQSSSFFFLIFGVEYLERHKVSGVWW